MNHALYLGIAAAPNVVCSELANGGPEYAEAARLVNAAVVALHRAANWSPEEMDRMGDLQTEIIKSVLAGDGSGG